MRRTCILTAAFWILAGPALAQQPTLFPGKTGSELRALIRSEFVPNQYLNYRAARTMMFAMVDNEDGAVELAYTSETFPINASRPIPSDRVVNTEHTWPQSRFNQVSGPGMQTDLFHLFPCRSPVNSERGNKPFAEIPDREATSFWNGPTPLRTIPGADIDKFSESNRRVFEPEEDHKGNVARAMLYFFTIYERNNNVDKGFFTPQVRTLAAWHNLDPADGREVERGNRIEQIQGNLNPYVIDPTLFSRAVEDLLAPPRTPLIATATPPEAQVTLEGSDASPRSAGLVTDPIESVTILALLPNPRGVDLDKESVTLANSSESDVAIDGWKLSDAAGVTFNLAGTVPAGQTLSIRLVGSELSLPNEGAAISLIDKEGARIQTVSYTLEQAQSGSFILFGSF